MKKKIFKIKKIFIVFFIFCAIGCSIEEVKPPNKLTQDNVITDANSAQLVLNGIYVMWRESDIAFFPTRLAALGTEGLIVNDLNGYNINQVEVENSYLTKIYSTHYKIINRANFLIQKLQAGAAKGISDHEKKRILSEAKFNRALAYFKLLKYFGQFYDLSSPNGVVIRTEFSSGVEVEARSNVKEVYNLIIKDLRYAVKNGSTATPHYYAGSLASKALLAKVKLYTKDYKKAAELAKEVISNDQGYTLENKYSDIFINTYNSSEVIFALYHNNNEGGSTMYKVDGTDFSTQLESLADAQALVKENYLHLEWGMTHVFLMPIQTIQKDQIKMENILI